MLITEIKKQRGGLFAIISQGEAVALVDEEALSAPDLCVGSDIGEYELSQIALEAECRRARTRAFEAVARRELCRAELISKLSRDFGEEAAAFAADEMESLGFIDDERFAEMYADELYRRQFGYRRVAHDIARRGVDRDLARSVAQRLAPDPAEAIDDLLAGRLSRDLDTEAGVRRCINTLMRFGYESSDIYAALRRLRDGLE